ncbi:hypothetical protein MKW92_049533 [Papaver armeniacum]|nr:hypothetical protein MKW92_049533 [Papaver armeniacum]
MPSARSKRNPREFLDENSQIRHLFFPDQNSVMDPRIGTGNDTHGGGILYVERTRTYYWYGENKDGPTYHAHDQAPARISCLFRLTVSCYSSKDLWTWKNEGICAGRRRNRSNHDLHILNVLERPKVIYNDYTRKYVIDACILHLSVMWMHVDDANYTKDSFGIAVSDYPTSPFEDDYLYVTTVMRRILIGKHRKLSLAHAVDSMMGPWETPCLGGNKILRQTTFFARSTYVVPLEAFRGSYLFMGDRWNPANLSNSRYIWLPLIVGRRR